MKDDEDRNRHVLHYVQRYYDWFPIVMFFVAGAAFMYLYLINGTKMRAFVFGIVVGGYCAVVFRPWQKRTRYVPYAEVSDGEAIPYTPVKEPFSSMTFEKNWATPEDAKHYEFPPAKNFTSPMTGKKYNEKGEPQDG